MYSIHLHVICPAVCSATSLEHGPNLITPQVLDNTVGAVITYRCEAGYSMVFQFDECNNKTVASANCTELTTEKCTQADVPDDCVS